MGAAARNPSENDDISFAAGVLMQSVYQCVRSEYPGSTTPLQALSSFSVGTAKGEVSVVNRHEAH